MREAEELYSCRITSVVTDGAANMVRMRKLANEERTDTIFYGCAAHMSNLLAKDISKLNRYDLLLKKTTAVSKFFNSHKLPLGWYRQAGGKQLILGKSVRWNTFSDQLESYLENHGFLLRVCVEKEGHPAFNIDLEDGAIDIGTNFSYKFKII